MFSIKYYFTIFEILSVRNFVIMTNSLSIETSKAINNHSIERWSFDKQTQSYSTFELLQCDTESVRVRKQANETLRKCVYILKMYISSNSSSILSFLHFQIMLIIQCRMPNIFMVLLILMFLTCRQSNAFVRPTNRILIRFVQRSVAYRNIHFRNKIW